MRFHSRVLSCAPVCAFRHKIETRAPSCFSLLGVGVRRLLAAANLEDFGVRFVSILWAIFLSCERYEKNPQDFDEKVVWVISENIADSHQARAAGGVEEKLFTKTSVRNTWRMENVGVGEFVTSVWAFGSHKHFPR